jgi:hypothetical protein
MVNVTIKSDKEARSTTMVPDKRNVDQDLAWCLMMCDMNFLRFARKK